MTFPLLAAMYEDCEGSPVFFVFNNFVFVAGSSIAAREIPCGVLGACPGWDAGGWGCSISSGIDCVLDGGAF